MILCPKFKTLSIRYRGNWFCPPNFTANENHLKICQVFSSYYLCIYFIFLKFLGDDSLVIWGSLVPSPPCPEIMMLWSGIWHRHPDFTLPAMILTLWHSHFVGELQPSMASQGLSKLHLIFVILTPSIKESDSLYSMTKQSVPELIGVLQPWTCTVWTFLFYGEPKIS